MDHFADKWKGAWDVIYSIPANARTRAIRLLDDRAHALRVSIQEDFNAGWVALVRVDPDSGSITINNGIEGERCTQCHRRISY
jgi:hypothetical protein